MQCIGPAEDPGVYILTETGEMFALNIPGAKVIVSPMILYALKLCSHAAAHAPPGAAAAR